ncbi:hypothetical protein E3Q23_00006 [Wallemia mellicola]|uniref:histone acetyltransferase n=1 Tax=Wallemia mellicola TaxID=1708541 RepID=A0A4T0PJQ2_9BASI|nr:hypothetical protein E3Q24_00295 [Wallemia mellicola]TIB79402.1 hypothetical protein E3Q23_00006 [Wallemia mellicola]TIB83937.1 hypothetical protein E3Q21_02610 [Wallemia mellicola]TIC11035.1 hypothetical protein E3Q14_02460 [Wallemia mellicola]TIC12320.1 hypothetical protein E3Q15_02342 [Wallemia mellicola]
MQVDGNESTTSSLSPASSAMGLDTNWHYLSPSPQSIHHSISRRLLISRHTKSDICDGYRPFEGSTLVLSTNHLSISQNQPCACTRLLSQHTHQHDDPEEEIRRAKVALRIDELLKDKNKLEDFDYTDEDIDSLRKQLIPLPKSENQQDDQPPTKKLKVEQVDEDVIPEQPKQKANVDVDALTVGVSVDADDAAKEAQPKKQRPAVIEERQKIIQFKVVKNDPSLPEEEQTQNLIILAGLKAIFQKQLPKMPREYIARLVYDRNHRSMAIVKEGLQVRGGITWRPFESRAFSEIVFCAITGTEQVKGYGSHLMNHLKDYIKSTSSSRHFLTYADNYAVGYFKKQGFTKEISLPREIWTGYIKDYEGGTLMQCSMLPKIKYLDVHDTLTRQKDIALAKIREYSKSHIVHDGLHQFKDAPEGFKLDYRDVPGLSETGWNPEMDALCQRPARNPDFAIMHHLLSDLQNHASSWAFLNPVNKDEVTDYYEVIKEPMDLSTMEQRLEENVYENLDAFLNDASKIFNNCKAYNGENSSYTKNAIRLEKYLKERVQAWKTD